MVVERYERYAMLRGGRSGRRDRQLTTARDPVGGLRLCNPCVKPLKCGATGGRVADDVEPAGLSVVVLDLNLVLTDVEDIEARGFQISLHLLLQGLGARLVVNRLQAVALRNTPE